MVVNGALHTLLSSPSNPLIVGHLGRRKHVMDETGPPFPLSLFLQSHSEYVGKVRQVVSSSQGFSPIGY